MLMDHNGARVPVGPFIAVSAALILILLGGVLALQLRPHNNETAHSAPGPAKPNYDEITTAKMNSNMGTTAVTNPAGISSGSALIAGSASPNGLAPLAGAGQYGPNVSPPGVTPNPAPPARTNTPRPTAALGGFGSAGPGAFPITIKPVPEN